MTALIKDQERFSLNYEFLQNVRSRHTAEAYKADLKTFVKFVREHMPEVRGIKQITPSHIIFYRDHLAENFSGATVGRKLACLSAYFNFLIQKGVTQFNPATCVQRPHAHPEKPTDALTEQEIERFCEEVDKSGNIMHQLIVNILLTTGIRRDELVKIKNKDIRVNEEGQRFIYVIGKRGKQVFKLITQDTWELLQKWQSHLASKGIILAEQDYLFISLKKANNPTIAVSTVYKMIKRYAQKAGIKKDISPHSFRATYVTHSIMAGIELHKIQADCGHSHISTTLKYNKLEQSLKDSPVHKINYLKKKA